MWHTRLGATGPATLRGTERGITEMRASENFEQFFQLILKICNSEIESFRASHPPRDPYLLWGIRKVGIANVQSQIENFKRD